MVSGHGKTKSYLHRFGFIDSPMCPCNILETQRKIMIQRIKKSGGTWPTTNKGLVTKYLRAFTNFINSIDFDKLT